MSASGRRLPSKNGVLLDKFPIGEQSFPRSVENPHEAIPTSENPVGFFSRNFIVGYLGVFRAGRAANAIPRKGKYATPSVSGFEPHGIPARLRRCAVAPLDAGLRSGGSFTAQMEGWSP